MEKKIATFKTALQYLTQCIWSLLLKVESW